jgi:hypothetical protein
MKLVAAGIVLLLLSSAGAQAGIFSRDKKEKLPKPIDHPIVRPKVREEHKVGKRAGQHPKEMQRSSYGAEWEHILTTKRPHPIPSYLYQGE